MPLLRYLVCWLTCSAPFEMEVSCDGLRDGLTAPFRGVYAREVPGCGLDTGHGTTSKSPFGGTYIPPPPREDELSKRRRLHSGVRPDLPTCYTVRLISAENRRGEGGSPIWPSLSGRGFLLPAPLPPPRPVSMVLSHYPGGMKRSPTRRVLPEYFPKCGMGTVGPPLGPASPFVSHFSLLAPTRAVRRKRRRRITG